MQERVSVSVEVMNKVMAVLGNLPYQQVAGLVQEVQQDVKPIDGKPDLQAVDEAS